MHACMCRHCPCFLFLGILCNSLNFAMSSGWVQGSRSRQQAATAVARYAAS